LLVYVDVYLAPDAPLGATVLAGAPLVFALGLDAGAVDEQVQRSGPPRWRMATFNFP
jgi:hypothetical protein